MVAPSAVNKDHNFCRRSCAAWCPHTPKCIFTSDNGTFLPCRNAVPLQHPCNCDNNCFGERVEEPTESPVELSPEDIIEEALGSLGLEMEESEEDMEL